MKKAYLLFALFVGCSLFIQAQVFQVGSLYYTVTDAANKKVMVVTQNWPVLNYTTQPSGNITIPSTVTNPNDSQIYTVVKIAKNTFDHNELLTGVVIPNTIEVIDTTAFGFCTALTSVVFEKDGANPLRINRAAFQYSSQFITLELPNHLTAIEDYAFLECNKVRTVTLSENLTELYEQAFFKLDSLKTFICKAQNLPTFKTANKEEHEPNPGAVFTWTDLSKVTLWIPEGTSSVYTGNPWIYFKEKREVVPVEKQVVKVGSLYYKITDLNNKEVMVVPENYPTLNYSATNKPSGNITIPSSITHPGDNETYTVTKISKECFNYDDLLTGITIPNTIEVVDTAAFRQCSNLTSMTFEDGGVKPGVVKRAAFSYCTSLTSIIIPDHFTTIQDWVFESCGNVTDITLPKNLINLYEYSFWDCQGLESLYCRAQNAPTVLPLNGEERAGDPGAIFPRTPIGDVDLYVPTGSSSNYTGNPWMYFKSIAEMTTTGNKNVNGNGNLQISRNRNGITISGLSHNKSIQIFAVNGQVIHAASIASESLNIRLNKGTYIVKIDNQIQKIVL